MANAYQNAINSLPGWADKAAGYLNPYNQYGQQALNKYNDFLSSLKEKMADFQKNYQESPQAKFEAKEALDASNNAAAGAGLLGGTGNRMEDESIAQNIAARDYEQQFQNEMGINKMIGSGLSEEIGRGMGAASDLASIYNILSKNLAALGTQKGAAEGEAHESGISGKESSIGDILGML